MEMMSERAVRSAERAIAERKQLIASQWCGLRERGVSAIARPSTLGVLALAGALVGWRSAGKKAERARDAGADDDRVASAPSSLVNDALRSLGVGMLRGFATMAVEELLRGNSKAAKSPPTGAEQADVENGEVSDSSLH